MSFLSKDVYQYRRDGLNQLMDEYNLDGFVVFSADFFQFFSNFHVDVQPWERPIAMIIPRDGKPHAVMNALSTGHIGFARQRDNFWVDDVSIYCEFPLDERDTRSRKSFAELLVDAIDATGLAGASLGIDISSGWTETIIKAHPETRFTTLVEGTRSLRWVKHQEEIAVMADISQFSDWIQERYLEEIRPGRLVHDLDYTIARMAFMRAADIFPGENFELRFYTLSGPSSSSPHGDGGQAGAQIENGHGIVNIIIPRLNGVTIENERTLFCGNPSDVQRKAFDAALEANEASIEQMVAGNAVQDIDAAARAVFARTGFHENVLHRTGHGVGQVGHEYPGDMPFNSRALLENEVYSAEPGIYLPGVGGFRIDDTVVVGADAPRVLTKAPKSFEHVVVG